MARMGAKNLHAMKKVVPSILPLVKSSYKLGMKRSRYELSLDYGDGTGKRLSVWDVDSIKKD